MDSRTILIDQHGGPEKLRLSTVIVNAPGPGEVQVRQNAIGVNFADIYQRRGSHGPHAPTSFPITLGSVGAGEILAIGAGVADRKIGQRVCCFYPGSYQVTRNIPEHRTVALPEEIDDEVAAATLLRGLSAEYLSQRLFRIKAAQAILVHAAAGGLGGLLCQWAHATGAFVIGTVGSQQKEQVARSNGCHEVFNYRSENFADLVLELTSGRGVNAVYDGVGRDVFLPSLRCLQSRGVAINYGTASGDVEAFDLQLLHAKSLTVIRPTLRTFIETRAMLEESAQTVFNAAKNGAIRLCVSKRYKYDDMCKAHREMEARMTTGSVVAIP